MDTNIAFVTLSTGSKHKITQETHNQILEAEKDDLIVLPNGTIFKNSAVMEIDGIENWLDEKSFNYGQPYEKLPSGLGFDGLIKKSPKRGLELMAKGIKRFIERQKEKGLSYSNSEKLLEKMRFSYSHKSIKTTYNPKYKTWEEAKAAKVF